MTAPPTLMSVCRIHASTAEPVPTCRTPTPIAARPPTQELTAKQISVMYVSDFNMRLLSHKSYLNY